jgi:ADP-heptose:LPS heptosyltransferase
MTSPRTVLVYRCGTLGDTLVALPAMQAVRRQYPGARLVLMTANDGGAVPWADDVLRDFGWFDDVVTYRSGELADPRGLLRVWARVRRLRVELVVHLGSDRNGGLRTWRDRLFFRLAGARRVTTARNEKATFLGRLRREPRTYPSEVKRLFDAVAPRRGDAEPVVFDVPRRASDRTRVAALLAAGGLDGERTLVAMCPGSKQPSKRWPVERYAEVGRRLIAAGADVVIVGGPDEAHLAPALAADWPAGRWLSVAGRTTVLESAEVLRRCHLYVGNDTGAMHLAAAVGTPCVAIFAAREPAASWHPYGDAHVVLRRDVPCANCYLSDCTREGLRCLTEIDVETAWQACAAALPAPGRRSAPCAASPGR